MTTELWGNPRRAHMRKPAVELSDFGAAWLDTAFGKALIEHGRIRGEEIGFT
jgi:hypothetical protein